MTTAKRSLLRMITAKDRAIQIRASAVSPTQVVFRGKKAQKSVQVASFWRNALRNPV